jgi:hypothetical protein
MQYKTHATPDTLTMTNPIPNISLYSWKVNSINFTSWIQLYFLYNSSYVTICYKIRKRFTTHKYKSIGKIYLCTLQRSTSSYSILLLISKNKHPSKSCLASSALQVQKRNGTSTL